jgi:hypothetical protein
MVTSFMRLSKASGTLGRPSGYRSPFHSGVRKISSSLEICCARVATGKAGREKNKKNIFSP